MIPPENSESMGIDGRTRFFFTYQGNKIGFKLIPKCGSTSVRLHLGMDEIHERGEERWLACDRRVVVIRHPADRLRSVYTGFSNKYGLKTVKKWQKAYGFKPGGSADEFLEWVLAQPDDKRDWHWQSASRIIERIVDDVTDYVAIEQIHAIGAYGFLPRFSWERLNMSDPEMTANTPFWTQEQMQQIEDDRPEDYIMWEKALANSRT